MCTRSMSNEVTRTARSRATTPSGRGPWSEPAAPPALPPPEPPAPASAAGPPPLPLPAMPSSWVASRCSQPTAKATSASPKELDIAAVRVIFSLPPRCPALRRVCHACCTAHADTALFEFSRTGPVVCQQCASPGVVLAGMRRTRREKPSAGRIPARLSRNMFVLYGRVAAEAGRRLIQTWQALLVLPLYPLILFLALKLTGAAGILGSLLMGLIIAACWSSYLELISQAVSGSRFRLDFEELKRSFAAHFWDVISVLFVFWLIELF